jgi:hypothetical protein
VHGFLTRVTQPAPCTIHTIWQTTVHSETYTAVHTVQDEFETVLKSARLCHKDQMKDMKPGTIPAQLTRTNSQK